MCDDVKGNKKNIDTKKLVEINKESENILRNSKLRVDLIKESKKRIQTAISTIPSKYKQYTFNFERKENEKYGKYMIYDDCNKSNIILNCEKLSSGYKYWKLNDMEISNNEKYLVFSVDTTGDGLCSIYIKSLFSSDILEIKNENALRKSGDLTINTDNDRIYYTSSDKDNRSSKVWYYDLLKKVNVKVYEEKDRRYGVGLSKSSDESKLIMTVGSYNSTEISEITSNELIILFKRENEVIFNVDYYVNRWYVLINNKSFSEVRVYDDDFKGNVLIKYDKKKEIEHIYIKYGYILILNTINGNVNLEIRSLCNINKIIKTVFLDNIYSIGFPEMSNMNVNNKLLVMEYSSFIRPSSYIILDMDKLKNKSEIVFNNKNDYYPINEIGDYNVNNYKYSKIDVNKKGLRMSILVNKNIRGGNRKCILYGYGSYGQSIDPEFSKYIPSLLDRGYIYCIAHIRGGGENGYNWYKEGKKLNKLNTFKDYIECAEYLINKGITTSDKLVAVGASAGGLLVGGVINMRPELFNVAVMGVPFVNVLSEMCDDRIPLTTEEYEEWGNPNDEKYFEYMSRYCPYKNIDLKKRYPNIYIYSNINDSLVNYKVPYYYYMKIKEADVFKNGEREIYLNIKLKYGHSGSSNHFEKSDEICEMYTMLMHLN